MSCMNNLYKTIAKHFKLEDSIANLLGSLSMFFLLGKIIGTFFIGFLMEKFSHVKLIYCAEIINILSVILMWMPNYWLFIIGRCLCGLYGGVFHNLVPRQIVECFPKETRGAATAFFSLCMPNPIH